MVTAAQLDGGSFDNCGGLLTRSINHTLFGCGNIGSNSVTLTVTDLCGNTASCMAIVTVRDTTPPVVTCPANVTVNADPGQCSATGVALGTPQSSDNCGVASTVNNAPGSYPVGTNTVVWTVHDAHGNSASCNQLVIVVDNQPPTITCPANVVTATDVGLCSKSNVTWAAPTATDNCPV